MKDDAVATHRTAGTTDLDGVRRQWNALGATDPMWAVLTDRKKRGAWDVDEFLVTGVREIDGVLADLRRAGVTHGTGSALDFGCGAGRLVQAMARHFEHVTGVDVAESMIVKAREINRRGDVCQFVLNERPDLSVFPSDSFDFVYSSRVLQHMPPTLSAGYIRELVRVTKPQIGVAVFAMPVAPKRGLLGAAMQAAPASLVNRLRRMQMHGTPSGAVRSIVEAAGGTVLRQDLDLSAGPRWDCLRYVVHRPAAPVA